MDSDAESDSKADSDVAIEVIFKVEEEVSSEDVPQEEWSSLQVKEEETNIKKILYADGLYEPGSGEICAKYIPLSASSILRHSYYKYPAIKDPGMEEALLGPPPKIMYSDDGQELYLALCEQMNIAPIRRFYSSLLSSKVDLSYYGLSSKAFRAISLALQHNRWVKVLDLTDNWMGTDACFHLGDMLRDNNTIEALIMKGCRIGAAGAEVLFHHLAYNRNIYKLDISRNQLGNKGVEFLANGIFKNPFILNLNLSYNVITANGVPSLVKLFETHNRVTHLDLSWKTIMSANAVYKLCQQLMKNTYLVELNLAWNTLAASRVGTAIKLLLLNSKSIKSIDLSNNRMTGQAIKFLAKGLPNCKTLETLNLSSNPLSSQDALLLLEYLRWPQVNLKNLLLDDVIVQQGFVEACKEILASDFRKDTVVTHGYVRQKLVHRPPEIKYLILKRLEAMGRAPKNKKNRVDFPMIILEMHANYPEPIAGNFFTRDLKLKGMVIADEMTEQLMTYFGGPVKNKVKTINLEAMVEYIKRLWPDKEYTPPPALPPLSPPPPPHGVKVKGKGNEKGKSQKATPEKGKPVKSPKQKTK